MNLPETGMPSRELAQLIEASPDPGSPDLAGKDLDDRERLRIRLVVETARVIREEGSEGFTLRRVAAACDTSTQMIYTLFGGKEGLVQALWEASFELLAVKCQRIPDELPPLRRLLRLAALYRRTALEDPVIYDALFGGPLSGFRSPHPRIPRRTVVFQRLVHCVEECMEAGSLESHDPHEVAEILWAVGHGVIDFEIAGYYENEDAGQKHYMRAQYAILRGFGARDLTPSSEPVPEIP